ncbi:MAG: carbamoyltransferase HypF [Actinobacteria bacterium]|nr:carbamoyltransferase HypF [Actinomycetota bacterium]
MTGRRLVVTGVVQGVGFRPHVYRLAHELGLTGSVTNTAAGVVIDAHGPTAALDELTRRVATDAPPLAQVRDVRCHDLAADPTPVAFTILASTSQDGPRTTVPPDCAICDNCLRELFDPGDRRYRHPFITCTDCGPRFTIVTGLPYDRPRTSMASFPMCPDCATEYHDPLDRRFHAQPVACPACGPHLWADDGARRTTGDEAAIALAQRVLADGGTVAVKGLGGFHLAVRADHAAGIARLRARKQRPDRPFALMAGSLDAARRLVELDPVEEQLLTGVARPIVLARRRSDAPVAQGVAPGSAELGVMLAYTPLHHLLLRPGPAAVPVADVLVMTSANLSDEPLCYRDEDAGLLLRLSDLVLGHDRPIVTPCDDSVTRVVDGEPYPVRRSRGYAPLPVRLDRELPATFAVGAELKNTVCVLDGADAVCSQHLGDMAGWESQQTLAGTAAHVLALYEVTPTRWAADTHPAYQTRAWAHRFADVPLIEVQHHRAHAASLLAENHLLGTPVLVACFDGTGYGDDGATWGGEWLLAGADVLDRGGAAIVRRASLLEVSMVGGDTAVREPWRQALAQLHRAGIAWSDDLPPVAHADPPLRRMLAGALDRSVAAVPTTSMGRLFDAVSALLGVRQVITYEAQAAIELEQLAAGAARGAPVGWVGDGAVAGAGGWRPSAGQDSRQAVLDPAPMLTALVEGLRAGRQPADLALGFHVWVARAVLAAALDTRAATGVDHVGLTGGVFANVLLLRGCTALLREAGFQVVRHRLVPCNDGGLSLGQAVLAAADGRE